MCACVCTDIHKLSQPQRQQNTTSRLHCSWVEHENDCAHCTPHHPTQPNHQPHKLNGSLQEPQINIYWQQTKYDVTSNNKNNIYDNKYKNNNNNDKINSL